MDMMLELMPGPKRPPELAECKHGLTVGCTFCSGKEHAEESCTVCRGVGCTFCAKPEGPAKAKKAADLILAENVAAGLVCPDCLLPYDPVGGISAHKRDREVRIPMGCDCQRKAAHEAAMSMRDTWLSRPDVIDAFAGRDGKRTAIAGMAFTSYNRSSRRAAVAPTDREADRLDIIERHQVEPRWTAQRVNESDVHPV